ncbi:hypothetical protein ACLOJK_016125 [Asimina triloba]
MGFCSRWIDGCGGIMGFRLAMAGDRDLLASDEDGARKMLFGGADLGRVAGIAGRMLLAWMKIGKMLWPDPMVRGCCWNAMTGRWV